jgi:hypothetical protein
MVITAYCSGDKRGYADPSGYLDDRIYVQSRIHGTSGRMKILIANKNNDFATLRLPGITGGSARIVDDNQPVYTVELASDELRRKPFATGVIILPR